MAMDEDGAARWAIRRDAGPLTANDQAELDLWLAADERHEGALLRAEAALVYLDRGRALAGQPLDPEEVARDEPFPPAMLSRRKLVGGGALIAAAIAGIGGGLLWPAGESFTTTIGEVRRLSLTDGSVATINTASRLTVTMAKTARRITLDDGEAWFEVAHDKARPFLVSAGDVHVRAVGTAFSVRRHTDGVDILVTEGVVETWTGDRSTAPTRLSGGERAFVADATTRIVAVPAGAEIERALSWRSGDLALNGEPLDYAVTELNRYNRRKLIVDDPVLGRTPIVGYFKVDDPDKFMRSVAVLLDARITTSGGDIHIAPKGS
ncbi:FecR family protein [Sphingomonas alpina]|uniref:FecR domain-containing protein n=1 Tax=Sphingomonas alpina TaxID=653931 RepID=A0A7H0LMN0_9SPHN|nr:FecR domain-containing protein [Sphingomonas alpina]QNQ10933.1 FecR domain-containing protein [Sphingomonas alpina]